MPRLLHRPSAALPVLLAASLLSVGCFEDQAEVTLHVDGSGSFRQTLRLAEQLVHAVEHGQRGPAGRVPAEPPVPVTREEIQEQLGAAGVIEAFEVTDHPDLSREVEIAGRFDSVGAFFASDYAQQTLHLRLWKVGDEIRFGWHADYDRGGMNLGLDQLYGLAKGMKVTRTVRAPADIRTEHDRPDGRSITWAFDLTNRAALAATKERLAQAYDGVWVAAFDAEDLDWADVMEIAPSTTEGRNR